MSNIRSLDCSKLVKNPKNDNEVTICQHVLFLLSSLVTGLSFMSISSLVLELWQFSFIRDWPEIRKSEIPPSEFCPISGDWGKLWIPNLARMSPIKYYWMLQNSRVTALTVFELLRENQLAGVKLPPSLSPPKLGLSFQNNYFNGYSINLHYLKWAVGIFLLLQSD